jgi:hypothetical protein
MADQARDTSEQREPSGESGAQRELGAPGGARRHVRSETEQGAAARPGGAEQHSGGAQSSNDEETGAGPGRGAD